MSVSTDAGSVGFSDGFSVVRLALVAADFAVGERTRSTVLRAFCMTTHSYNISLLNSYDGSIYTILSRLTTTTTPA